MADILLSGIGVSALSGSVGNTTFTFNAFGAYAKARPGTPAGSSFLTAWNDTVKTVTEVWLSSMTDSDRLPWYQFELRHGDALAFHHKISGFYTFMSCNLNLALVGGAGIIVPPDYLLPGVFDSLEQSGAYNIILHSSVVTQVAIYATKALSPGRMSNNQIYAYLQHEVIAPGANPIDTTTTWNSRFGGAAPSGMKIFFKVQPLDDKSGLRNVEKYLMCNT